MNARGKGGKRGRRWRGGRVREGGREGSEMWGNIRHEGVGGRKVGVGAGHKVGRN